MTFLIVLAALFVALLVGAALEPEAPRLHAEPWGSPGYICRTGCHPMSDCPLTTRRSNPTGWCRPSSIHLWNMESGPISSAKGVSADVVRRVSSRCARQVLNDNFNQQCLPPQAKRIIPWPILRPSTSWRCSSWHNQFAADGRHGDACAVAPSGVRE